MFVCFGVGRMVGFVFTHFLHGWMSSATLHVIRYLATQRLQTAAVLLKLSQTAACTAQAILHRFCETQEIGENDVSAVARACLYLGAKIEEDARPLREIITVFDRIDKRRKGEPLELLDYSSDEYAALRHQTVELEREVLCELGFHLHCEREHPHKLAMSYLRVLELPQLMQAAWSCANDSLRTPCCVRYPANVVACGCIAFAARHAAVSLPDDPPWWHLFCDPETEESSLHGVLMELARLHAWQAQRGAA